MKGFGIGFIAAVLGGLVVLGGDKWLERRGVGAIPASYRTTPVGYRSSLAPLDFTAAAEIAMPAVVHIKAMESTQSANERLYRQRYRNRGFFDPFDFFFGPNHLRGQNHKQVGYGSGVIISKEGLIVTNNHVIDFADELEITLHDNRTFRGKLIGRDPKSDLALLRMEGDNFEYLEFGNSDRIKVGEWVVAVGNPFDLTSTVTAGIVSAKGRSNIINTKDAIEDFIQTDAVVNPGNSGGALVDIEGNLIGINTAIASPDGVYAGYAFAIPSNLVENIVEEILKNADRTKRQPGYLGISVEEVDDYAVENYGIQAESGVVVVELDAESPARFAQMKPGDVIIEIDDQSVRDLSDIQRLMKKRYAGEKIVFTVIRGSQIVEIPVILRDRH